MYRREGNVQRRVDVGGQESLHAIRDSDVPYYYSTVVLYLIVTLNSNCAWN